MAFKPLNYYLITFDLICRVEAKSVAISVVMQNPFAQLKKIANHPYLVHMPLQPGTKNILVDENIIETSGKFLVLDAMLTKLEVLGHKVINHDHSNYAPFIFSI